MRTRVLMFSLATLMVYGFLSVAWAEDGNDGMVDNEIGDGVRHPDYTLHTISNGYIHQAETALSAASARASAPNWIVRVRCGTPIA